MTDKQIFIRAMEKAVKNGFSNHAWLQNAVAFASNWASGVEYYKLIFQHDFAKAFWKPTLTEGISEEAQKATGCDCPVSRILAHNWKYHLQTMVLEEHPLRYVAQFL